jgi:hypothetical protein
MAPGFAAANNFGRGGGMDQVTKHFVREGPGRWTCFEPCTLDTPVGRIQVPVGTMLERGKKFMNFDVAAALDEEYEKEQKPR